jgi:hypothetical protein
VISAGTLLDCYTEYYAGQHWPSGTVLHGRLPVGTIVGPGHDMRGSRILDWMDIQVDKGVMLSRGDVIAGGSMLAPGSFVFQDVVLSVDSVVLSRAHCLTADILLQGRIFVEKGSIVATTLPTN